MRFNFTPKKVDGPKYGGFREVKKFLIFPKFLNYELRWLETAKWLELYQFKWHSLRWLELDEK